MDISIVRPDKTDLEELHSLFLSVTKNAFEQDGIGDRTEGIQEEFEKQKGFLERDLTSGGLNVYFLVAKNDNKIVGTIATMAANSLIQKSLGQDLEGASEISSVFVLPEHQGKGIGTQLFKAMLSYLVDTGHTKVCLDGGYKKSQGFWKNKLGDPDVIRQDSYGEGLDYMVWKRNIKDLI